MSKAISLNSRRWRLQEIFSFTTKPFSLIIHGQTWKQNADFISTRLIIRFVCTAHSPHCISVAYPETVPYFLNIYIATSPHQRTVVLVKIRNFITALDSYLLSYTTRKNGFFPVCPPNPRPLDMGVSAVGPWVYEVGGGSECVRRKSYNHTAGWITISCGNHDWEVGLMMNRYTSGRYNGRW